ncbi:hypothetical protein PUNSTDRAFT_139121 [Punctularia strigosozonata HHB-11173 SS5]|uniref:Uncharacterized protein n=1 Tax=Punctularia strigosozonata (strain HHB-11173) TaxID=741275 RepID=R7S3L9_PUNST|nr:uncharacterized protein PUNSTDRAFT_139121 [Punctularia strigosozonata HHB-11173 SS5]EIN03816.1 hypothetical protein PUNSTDRAFT_139121 [Punctularia strigosozonata HHB-11173 SS5]
MEGHNPHCACSACCFFKNSHRCIDRYEFDGGFSETSRNSPTRPSHIATPVPDVAYPGGYASISPPNGGFPTFNAHEQRPASEPYPSQFVNPSHPTTAYYSMPQTTAAIPAREMAIPRPQNLSDFTYAPAADNFALPYQYPVTSAWPTEAVNPQQLQLSTPMYPEAPEWVSGSYTRPQDSVPFTVPQAPMSTAGFLGTPRLAHICEYCRKPFNRVRDRKRHEAERKDQLVKHRREKHFVVPYAPAPSSYYPLPSPPPFS